LARDIEAAYVKAGARTANGHAHHVSAFRHCQLGRPHVVRECRPAADEW
jgi:hypothetical protein